MWQKITAINYIKRTVPFSHSRRSGGGSACFCWGGSYSSRSRKLASRAKLIIRLARCLSHAVW